MSKQDAVTKKPVGNKTTEMVIGTAAAKLVTATKAFEAAISVIGSLDEKVSQSVLEVVNYEDKIGGLKQDYANQLAQSKFELELEFNKSKEDFVEKFLDEKGMVMVEETEWNQMKEKLAEATDKVNDIVKAAVGAATGAMQKDHNSALALAKMEFEKKEAENNAKIGQNAAQIKFLEEQVGHWKTMLDNQVKAETERAKYGQINTLNVGNPNAGR